MLVARCTNKDLLQGGSSNDWFPVQHILHDTGAVHASYVSSQWLSEQNELSRTFEKHAVNTQVLLGDSKTRVTISEAVMLKIKFINDDGKEYISDVLCYVIPDCPSSTPIILGMPALLHESLFFHFLGILVKGFIMAGYSTPHSRLKAEQYVNSLQELRDELIAWPSTRDPLSPEELETVMPDAFTDCLSFLVGTQEEAAAKYESDVLKFTDENWKQHKGKPNIIEYLNSPLVKQTFLPQSWEGFKNVQGAGANENDEFELNWDEENFPKVLDAKVRPVSQRIASVVDKELQRLDGYLWEPSTSPVCCGLTVAPKDTPPFVRIASDSRPINPFIKAPKEYIPNVQHEIMKMAGFKVFADIDQTNSFHQIKLALKSRQRLSVKTPLGLRQPKFVPEGISPGSAMLQRINTWIFRELKDCMVVMFDNLLIGGSDYDDLQQKLDKFFEICRRHNVICKMAKSRFGQDHANFFGYVVRHNSWELTQERKDTVDSIVFPNSVKSMQSFLGMSLFFKPFVEKYSDLTLDLNEMTTKNFDWSDKLKWTKDYESKFKELKIQLQNSQTLYFPDFNNEFILRTDASKNAVGGILLQKDKEGNLLPIAMVSCKLSETAQRWDAFKLECFAIYYCVKKLSHYLHGKEFIIETDHQNLQWLEKNDSAIVMRWRWYLQNYHMHIRHISGKKNFVADYFSRMNTNNDVQELEINNDIADTNDEVECKFYLTDDIAKTLQSYTGTSKVITDLYYDDPLTYHISGKDNWLRKRDKGFELKKPNAKGHQGGISRYMEITSNVLILEALSIAYHNTEIDDTQMEEILQENNIIPYAKIVTHRTTYGITMDVSQEFKKHLIDKSKSQQQHSFQIDVDRAQLECLISNQTSQYDIAEVELRKPYVMNPFKSITDVVTQLKIDPEVLKETLNGKLVECIRRHNDVCYDILLANGIVKLKSSTDEGKDNEESMINHCLTTLLATLDNDSYKPAPSIRIYLQHSRLRAPIDIKITSNMGLAFTEFIKQYVMLYTIPYDGFTFTFNMKSIHRDSTPEELNLKDGDEIRVTGEPYTPDGYVIDSSMASMSEYDGFDLFQCTPRDIAPRHFFARLTSPRDPTKRSIKTIELIDFKTNKGYKFLATFDSSQTMSRISLDYLRKHLKDISIRYNGNMITIPTIIQDTATGFKLEANIQYQLTSDQSGIVIGYKHMLKYFKTMLQTIYQGTIAPVEEQEMIEIAPVVEHAALNPIYTVGPSVKDFNRLTPQLRRMIMTCRRTVEIVNFNNPNISQRLLMLFDSGSSVQTSAISSHLAATNPDLFEPVYHTAGKLPTSIGISGIPTNEIGKCKVVLRCQHDATGKWYESVITLRIMDTLTPDFCTMCYRDCIQKFFDIFQGNNQTYRDYIDMAWIDPYLKSEGTVSPVRIQTKTLTFHADGSCTRTPLPLNPPTTTLSNIGNVSLPDTCIPCGDTSFTTPTCTLCGICDVDDIEMTDTALLYSVPTFPTDAFTLFDYVDEEEKTEEGQEGYKEDQHKIADTEHDRADFHKELLDDLHRWMKKVHGGYSLHMGAKRTYTKACKMFPGHKLPLQFFEEYVASCGTCQKQRAQMALAFRALVKTLKMPLVPRACVGIDTLCLPEDKYGNKYVHIIVQLFSKLIFAYVSKTNTADSVCDALLTYFATHGIFNVMNIDPGSNLLADAVQLINEQFDITQKVSMVDVHTSNGVENSGVKPIIRHLQALTSDFRIKDRWSEPKYLQYCVMIINNSFNAEINDVPFRLMWGDHNKLASDYLQPLDKDTNNKYIKDLWELQRIANEASIEYQKKLHDKRVAATPLHLANQYQPGDYVLRLREIPINNNKLQRLKYRGPYKVLKQEGNRVSVIHCSNNKEDVFPVEKLVIFDNSRNEAFKVAQLDEDEYLVVDIVGYKGVPMKRSTMSFLVKFEDEVEPIWVDYSADLASNEKFQEYCKSIRCLEILLMKADEVNKYKSRIDKSNITEVKPNDAIYVDLRTYSLDDDGQWYDNLNLPEAYTKMYVYKAVFGNFVNGTKNINIKVPIFKESNTWNRSTILWYGNHRVLEDNMILIDDELLKKYPQILDSN